jgi:hypothetical protein
MQDTQRHIIRQSSLKFINDYINIIGSPIGLYETVAAAEMITEYVLKGNTKEINNRLQKFDTFLRDENLQNVIEKLKEEMEQTK